ncbi:Hypothetical predicted protein, partial [Marmota monax]
PRMFGEHGFPRNLNLPSEPPQLEFPPPPLHHADPREAELSASFAWCSVRRRGLGATAGRAQALPGSCSLARGMSPGRTRAAFCAAARWQSFILCSPGDHTELSPGHLLGTLAG